MARIVIALGGNALGNTPEEQKAKVGNAAKTIVDLVAQGKASILHLVDAGFLVIACGGGAMLNPDSAAYARENGAVVLLNESFDTCYARIQGDTNRPIVQRSTKEELHQLFDQRAGIYRAHASHVVDGGVSPEQMAERVAAAVQ